MAELLEVKNLSVSFFTPAGEVQAVRDVSFSLRAGEVLAIVGESGCGKSVLCKSILHLLPPSARRKSGTIAVNGRDITRLRERELQKLRGSLFSMVFQDPMTALNPSMTVGAQLAAAVRVHAPRLRGAALEQRVLELMRLVGIDRPEERRGLYPHHFSGGMRQRVVLAIALAGDPSILFADEPTTALDVTIQAQILDLLREIQQKLGTATVFVTHDQEEAMSISDMIVVMKFGVVQQIGKPQDVYDNPANLFVANFLGTPPINIFTGHVKGERLFIGVDNVMDVPGVKDQDVFVGIRPEGFILDMANGTLCCKPQNVEVMGRDVSVVSTHEASQKPMVRSIIDADNKVDASADVVRYRIKPHKIFLFTRDDEGVRIPFEVK